MCCGQGVDPVTQTRVVELLKEDGQRSRDRVSTVKYESGSEAGDEVSMAIEWSGVSTHPHSTETLTADQQPSTPALREAAQSPSYRHDSHEPLLFSETNRLAGFEWLICSRSS